MCFHVCAVFYNMTSRFPLPEYVCLLCPLSGVWTQTWTWVQSSFLKKILSGWQFAKLLLMLLAFPTMCVTTACQCLHVFSCLSITLTPSSFLDMERPKCLHALDPKVEHQQFHKRCHSGLLHYLQHPPLLLYCQICISEPGAAVVPTLLCSALLWLKTLHLLRRRPIIWHRRMSTPTSQPCLKNWPLHRSAKQYLRWILAAGSCSVLLRTICLYNLSNVDWDYCLGLGCTFCLYDLNRSLN